MADLIGQANTYCISNEDIAHGFVHFEDVEIIGLFIDPDTQY